MPQYVTTQSWYNCQTGELHKASPEHPAIIELPEGVKPPRNWQPYEPEALAAEQAARASLPPSTAPPAAVHSGKAPDRDKLKPAKPAKAASVSAVPGPAAPPSAAGVGTAQGPRAADREVL